MKMELNEKQKSAALHFLGPCCVIAGAGSGKTAVLVARINMLLSRGVRPSRILAVTFSQKAAGEMRDRINAQIGPVGVCVSTFHSLGLGILRSSGYTKGKELIREYQKINFIRSAIERSPLKEQNPAPKHISSMIGVFKGTLKRPSEFLAQKEIPPDLQEIYKIYDAYERYKAQNSFYDFDDMTDLPVYLLQSSKQLRAAQQGRWDFILVDEYQDTNPAQDALLRLITPSGNNLFVVGDDWQSIYGFRGADIRNFLNFPKCFPNTKLICLDTNYRSTPEIISATNALVHKNQNQFPKTVKAARGSGTKPRLTYYEDEKAEASGVSRQIKRLADSGVKYSEMAILYRNNSSSRALEDALLLRDIPFLVQGGQPFWEQPYIADILNYLRLALDPDDSDALLKILNRPNRYLGTAFRNAVEECMKARKINARKALAENPLSSQWRYRQSVNELLAHILWLNKNFNNDLEILLDYIYDKIGYREFLQTDAADDLFEDREESIEEMYSLAEQYETVEDLLGYVQMQERAYQKNAGNPNSVTLSTIHKAKGLEYKIVFLVSCVDGIIPHADAENPEEERRILYVGMSRAIDSLELSTIRICKKHPSTPSPFLAEIRKEITVANDPYAKIN